jgi:hypothetical protein
VGEGVAFVWLPSFVAKRDTHELSVSDTPAVRVWESTV